MKKIPWWTIAAVAAFLWLLVGNFGRFKNEVKPAAAPAAEEVGPWTEYQKQKPAQPGG